jgi:hypothetical protein
VTAMHAREKIAQAKQELATIRKEACEDHYHVGRCIECRTLSPMASARGAVCDECRVHILTIEVCTYNHSEHVRQ